MPESLHAMRAEMAKRLAKAQREADHWTQVAASPNLSPRAAAVAMRAAMSARTEVRLRKKALHYQRQFADGESMSSDPHLDRVLGLHQ